MRLKMSDAALRAVKGANPRQTWAFVCSSRRNDAIVVDATIGFDDAKRKARLIGGVMRVGRVVDNAAETI